MAKTMHLPDIPEAENTLPKRDKEDNLYERLQQHSLTMLQKLSGKCWTDFNAHDPGVTIADILHYAIYECEYHMNSPWQEYLADSSGKEQDYATLGLLPAREIFSPVAVTPYDYENLIKTNIPEIKECRVDRRVKAVIGNKDYLAKPDFRGSDMIEKQYAINTEFDGQILGTIDGFIKGKFKGFIKGEFKGEFKGGGKGPGEGAPIQINRDFKSEIDGEADGKIYKGDSYDRLPLNFKGKINAHVSMFTGGNITGYFKNCNICITVTGLVECKLISGYVDYSKYFYTITIQLPENMQYSDKEKAAEAVKKLYNCNRNLCENTDEVIIGEIGKKSNMNNYHKNDVKYNQNSEKTPVFFQRPETPYHSIQHEFPDCYGINDRGLPSDASKERAASVLQLKAYLLIFDYILSGIGQQIRNIPKLLELSEAIPSEFLFDMDIKDLDVLLDKKQKETSEIFCVEELNERKSSYLNFLDGIYGEDTLSVFKNSQLSLSAINKQRAKLIRKFPRLNVSRFSSFDLTDEHMSIIPGIKLFAAALLGVNQEREITLAGVFESYGIKLVNDETYYKAMKKVFGGTYHPEEEKEKNRFSRVPRLSFKYDARKIYLTVKKRLKILKYDMLSHTMTMGSHGINPENYKSRKYTLSNGLSGYTLLYQPAKEDEWVGIGDFSSQELLIEAANCLWLFLEKPRYESFSFYVMEHFLLLCDKAEEEKDRLSIIIAPWVSEPLENAIGNYQEVLKKRLPVNLKVKFHEFDAEKIYQFDDLYFRWRKAWAKEYSKEDKLEVKKLSAEIREML